MKLVLFFSALFTLYTIAFCEMDFGKMKGYLKIIPKKVGTPGYCFTNETKTMSKLEIRNIKNKCMIAKCELNQDVVFHMCRESKNGQNKPDYSKPFPECCGELGA